MTDNLSFADNNFLASSDEIAGLMLQFAGSNSSRRRPAVQERSDEQRAARPAASPAKIAAPKPAVLPFERKPARSVSSGGRRERCKCGQCPGCIENARWERIFNEKFADPTYYTAAPIRRDSTLARLG
jgi:hypothetical protein